MDKSACGAHRWKCQAHLVRPGSTTATTTWTADSPANSPTPTDSSYLRCEASTLAPPCARSNVEFSISALLSAHPLVRECGWPRGHTQRLNWVLFAQKPMDKASSLLVLDAPAQGRG